MRSEEPSIDVVRHHRARRFLLRYDPVQDRVRLTIPRRASQSEALKWAATKRDWIAGQRAKRADTVPLEPGATIPFRGGELTIRHQPDAPRRVEQQGDALFTGGPVETVPRRIEQWLRREARRREDEAVAASTPPALGVSPAEN